MEPRTLAQLRHPAACLLVALCLATPGASAAAPFVRGDATGDTRLGVADVIAALRYLFLDAPAVDCQDTIDINDDGVLDVADPLGLLFFLFVDDSEPPPPPGLECTSPFLGRECVFQPGYDLRADDPFACGDAFVVGDDRPVAVHVPEGYDPDVASPLVLLLHGFGSSGGFLEAYRRFRPLADARGFLYAHPGGTVDREGNRFWNGTDACCDFFLSGVDDSAYLRGVIEDIQDAFNVDARRIYLIAHSNGGFMAHRMACEHADLLAAIATISGATFAAADRCTPSHGVHVLHIHGTEDELIVYEGGPFFTAVHPGAVETAEQWATHNGCSLDAVEESRLDLERNLPGEETRVQRYVSGCRDGGSAELWTIEGGRHAPALLTAPGESPPLGDPAFSEAIVDWLLAH